MVAEAARSVTVGTWAQRGLFALAAVFALREARAALAPVVIAIVLNFVLAPGVRWRLLRRFLEGDRRRPPSLRSLLRLPMRLGRGRRTQQAEVAAGPGPAFRG